MTDDTNDNDNETCPVPGCGLPYSTKIIDHGAFSVRPDTFRAAKLCVLPIYDEKPGFMHVYHGFDDLAQRADREQLEEHVHDVVADKIDGDYDAPGDISDDHATVFEIVRELTVDDDTAFEAAVTLGELRPRSVEAGVDKEKVESIALNLTYHGFIESTTNGVFKVPVEAVM